jgi:rubrerythrin
MNMQRIFKPLEDLERNLSILYKQFSERFADHPESRVTFYRLHLDEKAHLALVQYQKRVVRQNPKMFGEADIDLDEVVRLAAQVDERLWTKHPWTLREAVAYALDLEANSAEQHYHCAVKTTDGKISPLLRNLGAADDGHIRALVELGQREGLKGLEALRPPG